MIRVCVLAVGFQQQRVADVVREQLHGIVLACRDMDCCQEVTDHHRKKAWCVTPMGGRGVGGGIASKRRPSSNSMGFMSSDCMVMVFIRVVKAHGKRTV